MDTLHMLLLILTSPVQFQRKVSASQYVHMPQSHFTVHLSNQPPSVSHICDYTPSYKYTDHIQKVNVVETFVKFATIYMYTRFCEL